MNMPGFTAEVSLYTTGGQYKTGRHAIILFPQMIGAIYPTMDEEVINVYGCNPGSIQLGEGENTVCIDPNTFWGAFGDTPTIPTGPGGGGGGGGGGTPAAVPPEIVAECLKVGGKYGEKYCGGIGGPDSCKTCAQVVCQQKKCKETKSCDPAQLNDAKETNCDIGCNVPGCKDGLMVRSSVITHGLGSDFLLT